MNTRIAAIALVVLIVLVGGMIVLTGGQQQTPVAAATPSATVALATSTPMVTLAPTPVPTVAPTPVPTPSKFTISGKVTDAATGQPVTGVTVFVYKPGTPASWAGGRVSCPEAPVTVAQLQSKTDGSYQTAELEPGTYFVRISLRVGSGYTGPTFWNGQSQCQSASEIILQRDIIDINFALKR